MMISKENIRRLLDDPDYKLYFGRVEHLQSGETTRFQSESSLREFLANERV